MEQRFLLGQPIRPFRLATLSGRLSGWPRSRPRAMGVVW
jgi:hypothetical protein